MRCRKLILRLFAATVYVAFAFVLPVLVIWNTSFPADTPLWASCLVCFAGGTVNGHFWTRVCCWFWFNYIREDEHVEVA